MRKRNTFRRLLALLLSIVLIITLLPVQVFAETGSKDLDGHWAASAIETCHKYGIMNGAGNGYYIPNREITRAEFATMVNRAFGYDALDVPELTGYVDAPSNAWYESDMKTAIALGYLSANGGGTDTPEDKITREQAAVILYKVLRLRTSDTAAKFADMDEVSPWAADAVPAMEQSGYISGYNNQFMPKKYITRGETAQLLCNVLGVIADGELNAEGAELDNVTIRNEGAYLSNAIINGDLFISEGVGDGNIYLDNVWITGRLLIAGGGQNSIHVRNLTVGQNVVIDKPSAVSAEPVRFRAIQTNNTTVIFEGRAREVIITEDVTVLIDADNEKTVFNMFAPADRNAKPQLVVSDNTKIEKVVAAVPSEITGGGEVGKVEVRSGNVAIAKDVKADNIEAETGIQVTVGGEVIIGEGVNSPTAIPAPQPMPMSTPTPTPAPTPASPEPGPAPDTGGGSGGGSGSGGSGSGGSSGGSSGTTANAMAPSIGTQPQSASVTVGTTHNLTVSASVSDGGTLSYQWYSNASAGTTGGTAIVGATSAAYTAPISTAGIYYYYVVVTNTNNSVNGTKTATSNAVTLTVAAATAVAWTGLTANGANNTTDTTELTLTFDKDPSALSIGNITVTGAAKGTLSGTGTTRTLSVSGITAANGANVTVAITNPTGFTITPASKTVAVYKAAANAAAPSIGIQPQGASVAVGTTHNLTVSASVSDGGTLSYQWYGNTSAVTTGGTAISGATSAVYAAPVSTAGTYYYYVVVTNTSNGVNGTKKASVTSNAVTLTVTAAVAQSGAPAITGGTPATYGTQLTVGAGSLTTTSNLTYTWYQSSDGTTQGTQVGTGTTYTPRDGDTGKYLIVVAATPNATGRGTAATTAAVAKATLTINSVSTPSRTLIAFDSTDTAYGNDEAVTLSISGLVGADTVTLAAAGNTYGVSLTDSTVGNGKFTAKAHYDGTTEVTTTNTVTAGFALSDANYALSGTPSFSVKIIDGQDAARQIPVTPDNVLAFNAYATDTATRANGLKRHYKQTDNIVLAVPVAPEKSNWTAIGINASNTYFTGSYDGNGKTITNLTIDVAADYQGMFGYIDGANAKVQNLGLVSTDITGGSYATGGIAGRNVGGAISNCYVTGGVKGGSNVGGVAGFSSGKVENCYAAGSVSATYTSTVYAGGLVGYNSNGKISGSYDAGNVNAAGTGSGAVYVGGVAGYNTGSSSEISNCNATGDVSATHTGTGDVYAGGVAGYNGGTVKYCYYITGSVAATHNGSSGAVNAGGVAGRNVGNNSTISRCYATGDVTLTGGTGNSGAGGVAGYNGDTSSTTITNCYATGNVSATTRAGGVVGYYYAGTVQYCYAAGSVSGSTSGGVAGYEYSGSNYTYNCVALNPSVTVSGGTNFGRVTGSHGIYGTRYYNYAWNDMPIGVKDSEATVAGGTASNKNGGDVTSAQWDSEDWWKATDTTWKDNTGWDTDIWNITDGSLPTLNDMPSGTQNPAAPAAAGFMLSMANVSITTTEGGAFIFDGEEWITEYIGTMFTGYTLTVSAAPDDGYTFACWQDENGEIVSYEAEYSEEVTGDVTLTAVFEPEDAFAGQPEDNYQLQADANPRKEPDPIELPDDSGDESPDPDGDGGGNGNGGDDSGNGGDGGELSSYDKAMQDYEASMQTINEMIASWDA